MSGAVDAPAPSDTAAVLQAADPLRCRICGGQLKQRADDNVDVVVERLRVYHQNTGPLVDYYRKRPTFRAVNGAQSADEVAASLVAAVASAREAGAER